jgi:hypothetical protein
LGADHAAPQLPGSAAARRSAGVAGGRLDAVHAPSRFDALVGHPGAGRGDLGDVRA